MISEPAILLTGGSGYLGSHLAHSLIKAGYRIVILVRASSNLNRINTLNRAQAQFYPIESGIERCFQTHRIKTIIHCATDYGRNGQSATKLIQSNLLFPLEVFEHGRLAGVESFINTDTCLESSVSSYALSKAQFRDWLRDYAINMKVVNVVLQHFYGPGDDPNKFLAWLVRMLTENQTVLDLTAGEQRRDFIHIDDVCSAYIKLLANLDSKTGFEVFEVGSGETCTIRSIVEELARLTQSKAILKFGSVPYRKNEPMNSVANISRLATIGWKPNISLTTGLSSLVQTELEARRKLS